MSINYVDRTNALTTTLCRHSVSTRLLWQEQSWSLIFAIYHLGPIAGDSVWHCETNIAGTEVLCPALPHSFKGFLWLWILSYCFNAVHWATGRASGL